MITHEHIKATFASLVAIDSPSLSEREMADHIKSTVCRNWDRIAGG